jgi:tetratricopeptide (TPR) repeat protein
MQLLELIAASLFVMSTGILFNERFRKNAFLVLMAGLIAIASTLSFFGLFSSRPAAPPEAPPESAPIDPAPAAATDGEDSGKPERACADKETVTRCVDRLSRHIPVREATYTAYKKAGYDALLEGQYESAVNYLNVAIDNAPAGYKYDYLFRGYAYARMDKKDKFAQALSDCDRVNDPESRRTLEGIAALSGGSKSLTGFIDVCRGLALSGLGRHAEALGPLNAAIDAGFGDLKVYFARADTRKALGDEAGYRSDASVAITQFAEAFSAALGNGAASSSNESR